MQALHTVCLSRNIIVLHTGEKAHTVLTPMVERSAFLLIFSTMVTMNLTVNVQNSLIHNGLKLEMIQRLVYKGICEIRIREIFERTCQMFKVCLGDSSHTSLSV